MIKKKGRRMKFQPPKTSYNFPASERNESKLKAGLQRKLNTYWGPS